MKPPSVSIVLPTFNRLLFLREAVESVLAQTFSDWHLFIADDGSEPETVAYLADLEGLQRITVIRLSHTGNPAAVRNAALREANGEYIAFLDSDDLWLPKKLEVQVAAQRASTSRRWSYSAEELIDANGEVITLGDARGHMLLDGAVFEQLLTMRVAVSTSCVLAERGLIAEAGGFDEGQFYFEDYDLWLRLSLHSEVTAIDEPLVQIRSHTEHYSADRVGVYRARFRMLEKTARMAVSSRQHTIARIEHAKTAAALAKVLAGLGHRTEALRMLWKSRERAWRDDQWWSSAARTLSYVFAPSWLRSSVRNRASQR